MSEKAPKWAWKILITITLFLFILGIWQGQKSRKKTSIETRAQTIQQTASIYPNYTFEEGVNKIRVPLIPFHQILPREAGGWVITPQGSEFRIDYESIITVEYIDGRKFNRQPKQPIFDGVRPANSIFRLYGKEGEYAVVSIKRGVY